MPSHVKCKRCGKFIVRNAEGEWVLPNSKFPTPVCLDGVHKHEPRETPRGDGSGLVTGVAIGAAIYDAGVI